MFSLEKKKKKKTAMPTSIFFLQTAFAHVCVSPTNIKGFNKVINLAAVAGFQTIWFSIFNFPNSFAY